MRPLAVVGAAETDLASAVQRLGAALADRGAVATVDCRPSAVEGPSAPESLDGGVRTRWTTTDDGTWLARLDDRTVASVDDVLARLAPDHDYAVLAGAAHAVVPTVVLGDATATGPVVANPSDADALDVEAVVAAIEDAEPFETLESLVAAATEATGEEYAGAIATFTGRVRRKDGADDVPTERLEFEKHETIADERLATIREELRDREGVIEVLLHHRTGVVEAGEDIVFVVVLAGHRDEAFRTVRDGIDRLKAEVPLFKKEVTVEEEFWRHERPVE